jgi:hypothetical protein
MNRLPPDLADAIDALVERRLSPEEFAAIERAPMSDAERAGILENVEWFTRRYPTPAARLAYVRRAHARWRK